MDFFSKIFDWIAGLSAGLPSAGIKPFFICCLTFILVLGLVIGLTYLLSPASKLKRACKKIITYLAGKDEINDDNVSDFTEQCFSVKAPKALRETWIQYIGVRFGYPCDIVSERDVYEKEVKKVNNVRANVFVGIALVLLAVFAFWGFGSLKANEMSVIHFCGLALTGIIYIVLLAVGRSLNVRTRETFYTMQEDLDSKVNFQVEKNYSTDSSPLIEVAAIVDEIIAKNTSKSIDTSETHPQIEEYVFDDGIDEVLKNIDDAHKAQLTPIDAAIMESEEKEKTKALPAPDAAEVSDGVVEGRDESIIQEDLAPDYFETETEDVDDASMPDETNIFVSDEAEHFFETQTDEPYDYFENAAEPEESTDEESAGENSEQTTVEPYDYFDNVTEAEISGLDADDNIHTDENVITPDESGITVQEESIYADVSGTDVPEADGEPDTDANENVSETPEDEPDCFEAAAYDNEFDTADVRDIDASDETETPNGADAEVTSDNDGVEDADDTGEELDGADTPDGADGDGENEENPEKKTENGETVETAPEDIENQNKDGNDDMFGKKKSNVAAEQQPLTDETYGMYVESELAEKEFVEAELEPDSAPKPATDTEASSTQEKQSSAEFEEVIEEDVTAETDGAADNAEPDETDTVDSAEETYQTEEEFVDGAETVEEYDDSYEEETEDEVPGADIDEDGDTFGGADTVSTPTVGAPVTAAQTTPEEEVVYIQDTVEEDDDVAPAKLAKLPLLVDYMLNMNLTRPTKIKVASLMLTAYNAYKDSPQDKAIVVQCMVKLLGALK